MPKIKITPEFSDTLRKMRQSKKLTLSGVAEKIKKSTGYISNIENCKTDIVNLDDIYKILDLLTDSDEEVKSIMINHMDSIPLLYSSEEIEELNAMQVFDQQYRDISIENGYVEYIKKELEDNKLTTQQIMDELNSNRYIDVEVIDKVPPNKLIFSSDERHPFIVFRLPSTLLDDVIARRRETLNYITMKGILYAINLLKGFSPEISQSKAKDVLYQNKIYTIPERRELIDAEKVRSASSGIGEKNFNVENSKLPADIITFYNLMDKYVKLMEFIKDKNTKYVNSKLENMLNNLENPDTSSLSLGIMGLELVKIGELPPSLQKDFFNEVKNLIDQYSNKEKTVEIVEFE